MRSSRRAPGWWVVVGCVGCFDGPLAEEGDASLDLSNDLLVVADRAGGIDAPDAGDAARDDAAGADAGVVDVTDATEPTRAPCWSCPEGWVLYARGGCGPAVLLCRADGGAAPGACVGRDLDRPTLVADGDGGTVTSFYRLPDGGIGGGWPAPDWRPVAGIATCPARWNREGDVCAPALRSSCLKGAAVLPGAQCTATDDAACPSGLYAPLPAAAVGGSVAYVRAGAPSSGADGSEARPFPTIAAALSRVGIDGWVMLAAGEYREAVVVTRSARIVGACSARSVLYGRGLATDEGAVVARGSETRLMLTGVGFTTRGPALVAREGARVQASSARWTDGVGAAIVVRGAASQVTVTDAVVTGQRPAGEDGALTVVEGATLVASAVHVADNFGASVVVGAGSRVELSDTVIARTRVSAGSAAANAPAVRAVGSVDAPAFVSVARTLVEGHTGAALEGLDASYTLTDVIVRGTLPRADGTGGEGVVLDRRSMLAATGTLLERHLDHALRCVGRGTAATLTACVVREVRSPPAGTSPVAGVLAADGAELTLTRCDLSRGVRANVAASGGARVTVEESIVRDGVPDARGLRGIGVINAGATVTVTRSLVQRNRDDGLTVSETTGVTTVRDSVVRDTLDTRVEATNDASGSGLSAHAGGSMLAERTLLVANETVNVVASDPRSTATLRDVAVVGTRPQSDGVYGVGAAAFLGGRLNLQHVLFDGAGEIGVGVMFPATALGAPPSTVVGDDVLILHVAPSEVRGFGIGLGASAGARVQLGRVAIDGAAGAGVAAMQLNIPPFPVAFGSTVEIGDLFVRDIRPSTTGFVASRPLTATGPRQSFAVYAGEGSRVQARRAVLDGAQVGVAIGGVASIEQAVAARIDQALLRWSGSTASREQVPSPSVFCELNGVTPVAEEVPGIGAVALPIPAAPTVDAGAP